MKLIPEETNISMNCLCEGIYYGHIANRITPNIMPQESSWEHNSWYTGELALFEALATIPPDKKPSKITVLRLFLEKIFSKIKYFKKF